MLRYTLRSTPRLVRQQFAKSRDDTYPGDWYCTQRRKTSTSRDVKHVPKAGWPCKRYTAEENDKILTMLADGHHWSSIAAAMPWRSPSGIRNRIFLYFTHFKDGETIKSRMKQASRATKRFTKQELSTISDMVKSGYFNRATGTQKSRVGVRWTQEEEDHFIHLYTSGVPLEAVAPILGRSIYAVGHRMTTTLRHRIVDTTSSDRARPQPQNSSISQLQPSRRNYTTVRNLEPAVEVGTREHLTALTCGSQRLFGMRYCKQYSVLSLPHRPQHRSKHTRKLLGSAKMSNKPFSAEEDKRIIDLRAARHAWHKIADIMGRSKSGVSRRGQKLLSEEHWQQRFNASLTPPSQSEIKKGRGIGWTADEDALILDMNKNGKGSIEIGLAAGRHPRAVLKRLWRLREQSSPCFQMRPTYVTGKQRSRNFTHEELEALKQMASSAKSCSEIAQAFGCQYDTVYRRLRSLKYTGSLEKAKYAKWRDSEDQTLRSAIAQRKRGADVLQLLPGRTPGSIRNRYRVLSLDVPYGMWSGSKKIFKYWSAAEDAELLRWRASGVKLANIADLLGRSVSSCGGRLWQLQHESK